MTIRASTELLLRVFCDPLPTGGVDAAYLFGQTVDNERSVLDAGAALVGDRRARTLWIPDSGPRFGYPGIKAWLEQLAARGVARARVAGVPTDHVPHLHTLSEAQTVVRFAREQGIKSVAVVAAPFHQLRAFMTVVSVVLREDSELTVFSRAGSSLPWDEVVCHSMGTLRASRQDLVGTELERIERYRAKGDLVLEVEVLEYLRRRDGSVKQAHDL